MRTNRSAIKLDNGEAFTQSNIRKSDTSNSNVLKLGTGPNVGKTQSNYILVARTQVQSHVRDMCEISTTFAAVGLCL